MEAEATIGNLHIADLGVIIAYFVIVIAVGLVSSFLSSRNTLSGFFLAGRNMHWFLIGASLFASNIGSGHFIGLAGSGAASGIAVAGFELNAIFVLVVLGWLFVPVYIASGVYTMPEYMKKRFGGNRIRVYLSCLALILYVFTKISADLFAGAIFINQALNLSLYPSIGILLLIACVFTVAGGLTAVIWTDAVQVVIMVFGAAFLMFKSFKEVGGYTELIRRYYLAIPKLDPDYPGVNMTSCAGFPRADSMSLLRDPTNGDLPWPGMIFGLTIVSVWYWCSDQVMTQRVLAAKNYSHAKGGCVLASWLKFLPLWLLVFPGMAARVLFTDFWIFLAYSALCRNCVRGIMLAVMLSALMTSLTSIFNSSSTIFTIDIWKLIRKNATEREMLIVGRLFVLFLVVFSILWIPIIQAFPNSRLFDYIQSVQSYLAPPVCAVYVLAIFWPRTTEPGAFWGLIMGLIVGLARFILEVAYGSVSCYEEDTRPLLLSKVHYLHFGILLFGICCIVTIVVSLLTEPINEKHLYRLTFWSRYSEVDRISLADNAEIRKQNKMLELQKDLAGGNGLYNLDNLESQQAKAPPETFSQRPHLIPTVQPWYKRLFATNQQKLSVAAMQELQKHRISLDEQPFWRRFWNVQAILVMAIAIFFYAFYA